MNENSSRRGEKRAVLLDAAREVVLRFGYRKATLEDIASEAGVSRATLYYYFPNKEAVFRALLSREIERFKDAVLAAIDPTEPPEQRMLALVRTRYAHLRQVKGLYSVTQNITRAMLPVAMEELDQFEAAQREFIAALLREGIASGRFKPVDVDLLAAALMATLRGLDEEFVFDDRDALADGAACLFDALFHGLMA